MRDHQSVKYEPKFRKAKAFARRWRTENGESWKFAYPPYDYICSTVAKTYRETRAQRFRGRTRSNEKIPYEFNVVSNFLDYRCLCRNVTGEHVRLIKIKQPTRKKDFPSFSINFNCWY